MALAFQMPVTKVRPKAKHCPTADHGDELDLKSEPQPDALLCTHPKSHLEFLLGFYKTVNKLRICFWITFFFLFNRYLVIHIHTVFSVLPRHNSVLNPAIKLHECVFCAHVIHCWYFRVNSQKQQRTFTSNLKKQINKQTKKTKKKPKQKDTNWNNKGQLHLKKPRMHWVR